MQKNRTKNEHGFTLMESLIYVALFVVLSTVLIDSLIMMHRAYVDTRINRDLLDSAEVSMERMTREIRGSASLDASGSAFGSDAGMLVLNTTDAGGSAKTEIFSVVSGAVSLTENGVVSGNLTGAKVVVDSLVFRNVTTLKGSAIKIEMTIHSVTAQSRTMSLSNMVAMRGGY